MANRYWVGGTGTWTPANTANWSATSGGATGASVPTSGDNVFFDANSGSGTATSNGNSCGALDTTGSSVTIVGSVIPVFGNIVVTSAFQATGGLQFRGTSSSTLKTNGTALFGFVANASASTGKITLADDLITAGILLVQAGGFDMGGYSVTAGSLTSATGAAIRSFNAGSGVLTLTTASATTINLPTTANLTVNWGVATVILDASVAGNTLVTTPPTRIETMILRGVSAQVRLLNAYSFGLFKSEKTVAFSVWFQNAATFTFDTFTVSGAPGALATLRAVTQGGGAYTLQKNGGGTVVCDYMRIQESTATPSSTWYATNSTDLGTNTDWTFGAPPGGSGLSSTGATGSVGTTTAQLDAALTGGASAGAVGTLGAGASSQLIGVTSTGASGSAGAAVTVNLTSVSATGAAGSVGAGSPSSATLSGVSGAGSVAEVTGATSATLSGVSGSGTAGNVTASVSATTAIAGVSASGSTGSMLVADAAGTTGNAATGATGSVGSSVVVALSGVPSTGAVGDVYPAGDVSVSLSGVVAAGQVGNMAVNPQADTGGGGGIDIAQGAPYNSPKRKEEPKPDRRKELQEALEKQRQVIAEDERKAQEIADRAILDAISSSALQEIHSRLLEVQDMATSARLAEAQANDDEEEEILALMLML